MRQLNIRAVAAAALCAVATAALAQDPRESHYYYEILQPQHEQKPQVEGFAAGRVKESLGRGLTAVPAEGGRGVYLSWRLLESDAPGAAFHVWRTAGGKKKRLTRKPVTRTCDFTDTAPAPEAVYTVEPAGAGGPAGSLSVRLDSLKPYTSIRLKDGGESISIKSNLSFTVRSCIFRRISLLSRGASSISAPARLLSEGTTSHHLVSNTASFAVVSPIMTS